MRIRSVRSGARAATCALLLSFTTGAACSDSGTREAVRDSTRASVTAGASAVQRAEFTDGDERATWMLTETKDGGTSIEDNAHFGENGEANRVFTFDANGTLLRATEQRTQIALSGNQSPVTMRTEMIIDFTGSTPIATKMVDDIRKDVQPYEIDNLRRRADLLRKQAR